MNKTIITLTITFIVLISLVIAAEPATPPANNVIQGSSPVTVDVPEKAKRESPNKCEIIGKCVANIETDCLAQGDDSEPDYFCRDRTKFCCKDKQADLHDCTTPCYATTCTCRKECYETYGGKNGAKHAGETTTTGISCGGRDITNENASDRKTQLCPGNVYNMSGDDREKYELQGCPKGCFFFNHPGCLSDKGLGNAVWDLLLKNDKIKEWNDKWVSYWDAWGAKFDPMTYVEENICSPDGKYAKYAVGMPKTAPEGIMGGEAYASVVAMKQAYNYTNPDTQQVDLYLYTITWRIGGLSADNNYSIWVAQNANMETPLKVAPVLAEWFNLTSGEAHGGYKASKVLFMRRDFSHICIKVQLPICDYCSVQGINTCEPKKARNCFASDSAYWSLPGNTFEGQEYNCNHCKNYACVPIKTEEEYYADRGEPQGATSLTTTTAAAAGTGSTSLDSEFALLNPEEPAATPADTPATP